MLTSCELCDTIVSLRSTLLATGSRLALKDHMLMGWVFFNYFFLLLFVLNIISLVFIHKIIIVVH